MHNILVLGAGHVSRPLVRYLLALPDFKLLVTDCILSKAEALVDNHPDGSSLELNVEDDVKLEELIKKCDLAISLLPRKFHVKIAKLCLKNNKHMVTTSYISSEMKELDEEAKRKSILLLNEIGVDPGIDHMSALRVIHRVEEKGGKIISFESITGGLPAPDANDNPFGYKFSWSPRGVVMAGKNDAIYLREDIEVQIEGKDLFKHHWLKNVDSLGKLEVYPNRDSMLYLDLYGLHDAQTIFRGTFRNKNWCETNFQIAKLGYLDETDRPELSGRTFAELTAGLIGESDISGILEKTAKFLEYDSTNVVITNLEWLGLFGDDKVNSENPTYLDILVDRMLKKMNYKNGERDMIVMQHDFIAEYTDGSREKIESLLIDFGIPGGDTSMSRLVSLPAAIAAKLILQGKIKLTGVHIPNTQVVYDQVMDELESMGIKFKETVEKI